jgi:hypothetical protein
MSQHGLRPGLHRIPSSQHELAGAPLPLVAWCAQFLFMGPTPLDVMDQYTSVAGRPAMMPYWTLGFHQCKWVHSQTRIGRVADAGADVQAASPSPYLSGNK